MSRDTDAGSRWRTEVGSGLAWTGHPLVDMGIATLVAFAGHDQPGQVTFDDLDRFAQYAEQAIFSPSVRSHASVLYTINNDYLNPSFDESKRRENAAALFRRFASPSEPGLPPCGYCGRPAVKAASSAGPGYRDIVPMVTGRNVLNFFPYGQHGLPLCGLCLTALQALPFGAPSCEGRALVVAGDNPSQVVALVKSWLPDLRQRVQLSQATGQKVDTWKSPRSRLVERLVELERQKELSAEPAGFTVYHLSNSGQGPGLTIYTLPASVVRFLRRAQGQAHYRAWGRVAQRAWLDAKNKAAERTPGDEDRLFWRNRFYEALFDLRNNVSTFVRRYFVRPQQESLDETKPVEHVPLWGLTQLFLQEALGMDASRVEAIRDLADGIADEVVSNDDRRLFQHAYQVRSYYALRRLLIRASSRRIARGQLPLLSFEGFLTVFEVGNELPRTDWRLAWDLVLIRLIDDLHAKGWFRRHTEAVAEIAAEEPAEGEQLAEDGDVTVQ